MEEEQALGRPCFPDWSNDPVFCESGRLPPAWFLLGCWSAACNVECWTISWSKMWPFSEPNSAAICNQQWDDNDAAYQLLWWWHQTMPSLDMPSLSSKDPRRCCWCWGFSAGKPPWQTSGFFRSQSRSHQSCKGQFGLITGEILPPLDSHDNKDHAVGDVLPNSIGINWWTVLQD